VTDEIIVERNVLENNGNHETALIWNVTKTPAMRKSKHAYLIGPIVPVNGDDEKGGG
jgi:hypothetical protein